MFPVISSSKRIICKDKYNYEYKVEKEIETLDFHNVKKVVYAKMTWASMPGIPKTYDLNIHLGNDSEQIELLNFSKKAFDDVSNVCDELGILLEESDDTKTVVTLGGFFRM
jgi:hypothetical protein